MAWGSRSVRLRQECLRNLTLQTFHILSPPTTPQKPLKPPEKPPKKLSRLGLRKRLMPVSIASVLAGLYGGVQGGHREYNLFLGGWRRLGV